MYFGVCHSDLHMVRDDWGSSSYPLVPGHEIVGRLSGVGAAVTRFKPGDQVGIGCMVDSCQQCDPCKHGLEQYCETGHTLTYASHDRHNQRPTYGGYSEKIVASENFVLKVPDGLDLAGAAPLLCAGITMWSPWRHWKAGKGSKVSGTLVLVGYVGGLEPFLSTIPLILGRKSVAGSVIGGIAETQELLDFCGQHGITSDVEIIRIQDINAAYERLLKSDVMYRFVIDMASLKS